EGLAVLTREATKMARFRFSLEGVLRHRRRNLLRTEAGLLRAAARVRAEQAEANAVRRRLSELLAPNQAANPAVDLTAHLARLRCAAGLRGELERAEGKLREAERLLREAEEEYRSARQDAEILTTLRDRRHREFVREQARLE